MLVDVGSVLPGRRIKPCAITMQNAPNECHFTFTFSSSDEPLPTHEFEEDIQQSVVAGDLKCAEKQRIIAKGKCQVKYSKIRNTRTENKSADLCV